MAEEVIIEGSRVTPSDRLGRGVRAKVQLTEDILKLVRIGAVIIVDQPTHDVNAVDGLPESTLERIWSPGDPAILPEVPQSAYGPDSTPLAAIKPPPRNGATVDWAAWVNANVADAETEGKSRDELIAIWDKWTGAQ